MRQDFDIVVIGASVGGLAAATLLARRGKHVLLLEEQLAMPEPTGALFALDPELVTRLKLVQHGLAFSHRDLALTGWEEGEPPLTLSSDRRATARTIAAFSKADAQAWAPFQAMLQSSAHAMRRWWWHPHRSGRHEDMLRNQAARERLARDSVTGAEDFLRLHFESPRLISLLLADAMAGGFAPSEPGSALALIWRAAQEMNGHPASSAVPQPGTLIQALRSAARAAGVMVRMGARVTAIRASHGAAAGVVLDDGEEIAARLVLSSLPRGASEALSGLEDSDPASVGMARLLFTVGDAVTLPPQMIQGRVVLTPAPPDDYADAHEAARAGRLPAALPMICVSDAPRRLAVTVPLVAATPKEGWPSFRTPLSALAVKTLARHIPGFAGALMHVAAPPPPRLSRPSLARLVAPAAARAATRLPGLYLCGEDSEPLPCVSGRSGRFAAFFAHKAL